MLSVDRHSVDWTLGPLTCVSFCHVIKLSVETTVMMGMFVAEVEEHVLGPDYDPEIAIFHHIWPSSEDHDTDVVTIAL